MASGTGSNPDSDIGSVVRDLPPSISWPQVVPARARVNSFWFRSVVPLVLVSPQLHRGPVDVVGDRRAHGVADGDSTGVVHAAPDSGVISVLPGLRDARIGAACLSSCGQRGQRKGQCVVEVAEGNGRCGPVEALVPGCVFGVRGCVDQRRPSPGRKPGGPTGVESSLASPTDSRVTTRQKQARSRS